MRFFAATLLLLLAFAAAEEKPAHCRFPDRPSESKIGELDAARMICHDQGNICDVQHCTMDVLDLLDDDGHVKPQELVDYFLPGEGYEETKEFFVEAFNHCKETGEGDVPEPEGCDWAKPLQCATAKYENECM